MLLLLTLLGLSPAIAQSDPAAPTSAPAPLTPEQRLDEAVYQYQTLQKNSAIVTLDDLSSDPRVPTQVRLEALIYIGEIYLLDENTAEAERYFTAVIEADPTYEIDHFRHPPEVGVSYGALRQRLIPTLKPPPPPPSIFLPALHYEWRQWPAYEGLLAGTEVLFATGATGLNVYLLVNRRTFQDTAEDRLLAAQLRTTQLSCFGGFVGMHVWRTLRARKHHQETWRGELLLGQSSAGEPPLMLSVQARF